MAGLDANEALQAIGPSLNLASAGGLDLAAAADQVTNIMGQMGMEFSETQRAVDVLAKTASSSNTTVIEMAEAFKFVGPTARAMGVDIEETAAVIGTLANAGLKAGIGSRALSTALAGLASPEIGRKLKKQLDIAAFTDEGKFIGIINLIAEMNKAFVDMTDQTRLAVIGDVFGKNALQEMDILLNAGVGSLREFEAALDASTNAAKNMAETNLKGLNGQLKKLKSAFQDVLISIGESGLLKLLTQNAKRMTDFFATVASSKVAFDFFTSAVERLKKGMTFLESASKIFVLGLIGWRDVLTLVLNKLLDFLDFMQTSFVKYMRWATAEVAKLWLFMSEKVQKALGLISSAIIFILEAVEQLNAIPGVNIEVDEAIANMKRLNAAREAAFVGFNEKRTLQIKAVNLPIKSIRVMADEFGTMFAKFIASQKGKLDAAWAKLTEPLKENMVRSTGEAFEYVKETVEAFANSEEVKQLGQKAQAFSKEWVKFGTTMEDTIVNAAVEFKSFGGLVDDVLKKIRENMIKSFLLGELDVAGNRGGGVLSSLFSGAVGGGIGGFFSNLFKARGGPVSKGDPYIVGERGPELFSPSENGSIIPNNKLGNLTSARNESGGVTKSIQINNNFDIRGSEQEVQRMIAQSVQTSVTLAISENQNLKQRGFIR